MQVKTLEAYNKEQRQNMINKFIKGSKRNGILCKCGEELFDTQTNTILASYPPKKKVHCEKCDFKGYRIYL